MAEKKTTTSKVTATAKKGIIGSFASMVRNIIKETWDEVFQLFILGSILGVNTEKEGNMKKGENSTDEVGKIGILSKVFHPFTDADEIKWNTLFSFVRLQNPQWEDNFMLFKEMAVKAGNDEDTLRNRLIGGFSKEDEQDPAVQTVKTIAEMHGDLDSQIQFAKNRKLLVRKSVKNFLLAMNRNKMATLMWVVVIVLGLLRGCVWIFS